MAMTPLTGGIYHPLCFCRAPSNLGLFGARGRRRGFGRERRFRDFVQEYAVPSARQPACAALRRGFIGEGTYPDPVIPLQRHF
jgi:hypothetical protein